MRNFDDEWRKREKEMEKGFKDVKLKPYLIFSLGGLTAIGLIIIFDSLMRFP